MESGRSPPPASVNFGVVWSPKIVSGNKFCKPFGEGVGDRPLRLSPWIRQWSNAVDLFYHGEAKRLGIAWNFSFFLTISLSISKIPHKVVEFQHDRRKGYSCLLPRDAIAQYMLRPCIRPPARHKPVFCQNRQTYHHSNTLHDRSDSSFLKSKILMFSNGVTSTWASEMKKLRLSTNNNSMYLENSSGWTHSLYEKWIGIKSYVMYRMVTLLIILRLQSLQITPSLCFWVFLHTIQYDTIRYDTVYLRALKS